MARRFACLVLLPLIWLAGPSIADTESVEPEGASEASEPEKIPLVEQTAARLAQLDVTVTGPAETILNLTAEDFTVKLGIKRVKSFQLDRFCGERELMEPGWSEDRLAAADPRTRRASYIFYFDQPHLTLVGRNRSMELARELIPKLIQRGNRGMVVSNAAELVTVARFTNDSGKLLGAIDRLEQDRTQWDFFATQEENRVAEVVRTLNRDLNIDRAITMARSYQREERWRTEKNLRRLETVLGRLAQVEPPKAVVYFADTLRANAGEHYMSFFGERLLEADPVLARMSADSLTGYLAYDRVVNQASAQGIRFYAVQAEGLAFHVDRFLPNSGAVSRTAGATFSSRIRTTDAQNTLASLSQETGGYVFLNGAPASRIAEQILVDFSCLYLISFDPSAFSEDVPHRVVVQVNKPGVKIRSRGRIVLQSESARLTSRLLGAFSSPDAVEGELSVRSIIVPTGYHKGVYSALVQVSVPGMPLSSTTWDMGASLVSRDKVRAEASGRLSVSGPGIPVVLESEMNFPPGPYEIVAVVHETKTDQVASIQSTGFWPNPNRGPALVGPIALLQPQVGAFIRDGSIRTSGSVARQGDEPVYTNKPTAFVGLVCRGRSKENPLWVERSLWGDSPVEFPAVDLELTEDRCAQVRDLVPARTLGPGSYVYELRVVRNGDVVSRGERGFIAVDLDF